MVGEPVYVRLEEELLEEIERLGFRNRSEFIRFAVSFTLERLKRFLESQEVKINQKSNACT